MSIDLTMQKALEADMAVINDNGTYDYVDNSNETEVTTIENEEKQEVAENNNNKTNDDTDFFFD